MRRLLLWLALLCSASGAHAQMWTGQDTLYGPEWIRHNTTYWRIPVAADGWYRIGLADLEAWGWTPAQQMPGGAWRLYHNGREIPLYLTREDNWSSEDYAAFWGQRNRGELDAYLFKTPTSQQLNPEYSLINDTAAYYLAWIIDAATSPRRYVALPNDLSNPPPATPYLWRESSLVFSERYLKEYLRTSDLTIYFSQYGIGEGYGTRNVDQMLQDGAAAQSFGLPVSMPYAAGPAPQLTVRYACAAGPHQQQLLADGELVYESAFNGWKVEQPTIPLPASINWADGLMVESRGIADSRDEASLALATLRYPALPNAQGQSALRFSAGPTDAPVLLEITNFPESAGQPVLYDLGTGRRIVAVGEGGLVRALLPAAAEAAEWLLVGEDQGWLAAPAATARTLTPLAESPADFLIITHSRLRQGATDWVSAYADYRRSPAGGGYRVAVVDIADLYDQFAYGVERHPLAIRNFIHWLRGQHNGALRYVFLMGKGRDYNQVRTAAQVTAAEEISFFLPSFGFPASDNLLAAGNHYDAPKVALGRLPAVEADEVRIYLAKVQALESQSAAEQTVAGRAWMKNVIHLGGGGTAGERQSIRTNLEQMAATFEQSAFGARTSGFYKSSTDPIQTSLSDQIFGRINEGVSVITFFGHSSPGVFDFNIDNPDNYANAGKYPLMLSLGCYSGDMFVSFRSIGERFIFLPDKGAAAFGATKGFGYIHALYNFGRNFYQQMGGAQYGQGIGDGLKASYADFEGYADMPHRILRQQFALNGDPALKLNPAPGADYLIVPGSVRFAPSVVSVQSDSFEVSFDLMNLGRHLSDTLSVQIDQQLPDGQMVSLGSWRGAAPPYVQTIRLRLPTRGRASVGLNTLFFAVDPADEREELPAPVAELNNDYTRSGGQRGAPLYVVDNVALPVWPTRYALVGEAPITLKASTADALAPVQTYLVEVDTDPRFSQPLARTAISQGGGVVSWTPPLNWLDSTVYYWRISPDSLPGSPGYTWETSSFTYVAGSPAGWSQGHWGQWRENEVDKIAINETGLEFIANIRDLFVRNSVRSINNQDFNRPGGFVNGNAWSDFFRWNISQSLQIVVVDTLGRLWRNANPGQYGSVNTSTQVAIACFSFPTATQQDRTNIINFLQNTIPPDHLVLVYPAINDPGSTLNVGSWAMDSISLQGSNIFNVLEAQGASRIRELVSTMRPYIFVYRKDRGLITELIADNQQGTVSTEVAIPGYWTEGSMHSGPIGPAKSWAFTQWMSSPTSVDDTIRLSLYGIKLNGERELLADSLSPSGMLNLQDVSADTYPFLLFDYFAKDQYETTCPQIDHWTVIYEGRPDLALNASADYIFEADSLQQGAPLKIQLAIENVTTIPTDSTSLAITVSSEGGLLIEKSVDIPALAANARYVLSEIIATDSLQSQSSLSLNLNPDNILIELTRINNQAFISFEVLEDDQNPLLDITFDGRSITDGEIVAAKPFVRILLRDENEYLLVQDTSSFLLQLRQPDGIIRPLYFSQSEIRFYPALNVEDNEARVEWEPVFEQSGKYQLIVRARDASGNVSGRLQYEVNFEVILERRISNLLPYPNPFSTATYFVYTLTGDEPPLDYSIQIMTVSGRVVRELTQEDLGALKIGTHRTDFTWDGTDEWGEKLANGVYLYRVMVKDNAGDLYDLHTTDVDRFFKNDLGKIVILR